MKIDNRRLPAVIVLALCICAALAAAQSPEEFQKRRQAVRAKMEPNSVLILRGGERSGEGPYRQDNNLYYLTGIPEPGTSLVLYADSAAGDPARGPGSSARQREILFWAPPGAGDS